MGKWIGVVLVAIAVVVGIFVWAKRDQVKELTQKLPEAVRPSFDLFDGVSYEAVDPTKFSVGLVAEGLDGPSRVKITPDNRFLLVAQLSGEVVAFTRQGDNWVKQTQPIVKVDTRFAGFPPDEAGLTGIVFSSRYVQTGKIFLLYSYKDADKKIYNRISSSVLSETNGQLAGSPPVQVFQANVAGQVSHQITDGWGVEINNTPHIVFLVGEGFKPEQAQNTQLEAGKVMLIQEDGTDPVGQRPYPENPKIQAVGLRNGYVLARNLFENSGRFLIGDTGPDHFDRLIFTELVHIRGIARKPVNLGWTGDEAALATPIADPNYSKVTDMVLTRLENTQTFTGLAFHPGGRGAIPRSVAQENNVLVTVFGKTGSTSNGPGKEIWLGRLKAILAQPTLEFEPIVKRAAGAEGFVGNPVGLEVDGQNGNIYFADIMEGRLYVIKVL